MNTPNHLDENLCNHNLPLQKAPFYDEVKVIYTPFRTYPERG